MIYNVRKVELAVKRVKKIIKANPSCLFFFLQLTYKLKRNSIQSENKSWRLKEVNHLFKLPWTILGKTKWLVQTQKVGDFPPIRRRE